MTETTMGPGRAPGHLAAKRFARAYCGPAHGIYWRVSSDVEPAGLVSLSVDGQLLRYRLVLHPLTRRPARDDLGDYLYLPLGQARHDAG